MVYSLSGFTTIVPAQFWDTATPALSGSAPNQYYRCDWFSRVVIQTSSTSLIVEAVPLGSGAYDEISLWVNGVYNQTLTFTGAINTKQQLTATLPAGDKIVELVNDAFLTGISAASYTIQLPPVAVASRLVEWGDSIGRGYYASPFGSSHMPNGIRQSGRYGGCTNLCNPGDALFNYEAAIPALVTFILARFADCSAGTRVLFLEMVTNDYGLDQWSASSWAPVYASLLDQLHAADPALRILCNKGLARTDIGAQPVHGSTFADFQSGVVTAASTRSWCQVLTVPSYTTADLVDNVHPNNGGHAKIAAAVVAAAAVGQHACTVLNTVAYQLGIKPLWYLLNGFCPSDVNDWLAYALSDAVQSVQLIALREQVRVLIESNVTPDAARIFEYYRALLDAP